MTYLESAKTHRWKNPQSKHMYETYEVKNDHETKFKSPIQNLWKNVTPDHLLVETIYAPQYTFD